MCQLLRKAVSIFLYPDCIVAFDKDRSLDDEERCKAIGTCGEYDLTPPPPPPPRLYLPL